MYTSFNTYSQPNVYAYVEKINTKDNNVFYKSIYSIETDDKGYVYLATDNGIYIYDGTSISIYNEKLTGPSNEYVKFYKSDKNTLYAFPFEGKLTRLGINGNRKFEKGTSKNYEKYTIHSTYIDQDSTIFFIGRVMIRNAMYLKIEKEHPLVLHLYDKGIMNLNSSYVEYVKKNVNSTKLQNEIINNLENIADNEYGIHSKNILSAKNKLYYIKKDSSTLLVDLQKFGIEGTIVNINFISKNKVYICIEGKNRGLYIFDGLTLNLLYNNDDVTNVVQDKFGNLFFSTLHLGLFKISKPKINYKILSFQDMAFQHITLDTISNLLYISDNNGNLYSYNENTSVLIKNIKNKENYRHSKFITFNNGILYSLEQKIYYIQNKQLHTISDNTNRYNISIITLFYTEKKNKYITIDKYIISQFDTKTNKYYNTNTNSKVNNIIDLDDSTLQIITKSGLYNYNINSHSLHKLKTNTDIDENGGEQIIRNNNNLYYLSNNTLYEKGSKNEYNQLFKFNSNTQVIKILYTKNNNIICLSSSGFNLYNSKWEIIHTLKIDNYEYENEIKDGLLKDSTLLLFNSSHLYQIPIYNIDTTSQYPTVYPSFLVYGNDTIRNVFSKEIKLKYNNTSNLNFYFDIFNKKNTSYPIRLMILDEKNNEVSNHFLETNSFQVNGLSPGTYYINIHINSKILFQNKITILPLWHQHLIFKILLGILFISITIIIIYLLIVKKNELKTRNEFKKNRLFKLESFAKLNQLKSHFIFNALSPLQNYILRNQNENAINYLHNFSDLLRGIMNMASIDFISLQNEIDFLKKYLKIQSEEKSNSFTYEFINHNDLASDLNINIPPLILQPILENAINHGISSISPQKGHITIEFFTPTDDFVLPVTITDNGYGCNDLFTIKKDDKVHALQIIKERLSILSDDKHNNLITHNISELGFEIKLFIPIK